jgi:hypothetical protein
VEITNHYDFPLALRKKQVSREMYWKLTIVALESETGTVGASMNVDAYPTDAAAGTGCDLDRQIAAAEFITLATAWQVSAMSCSERVE